MLPRANVQIALHTIATKVGAKIARGDGDFKISALCALDEPKSNALAFSRHSNLRRIKNAESLGALIAPSNATQIDLCAVKNLLLVDDPQAALFSLSKLFYQELPIAAGVSPHAIVDPSVQIGKNVKIGAFCVIGINCTIDDDTVIHPHVVIYGGVKIGKGCTIHAGAIIREGSIIGDYNLIQNGAVIGAEGFGYVLGPSGLQLLPHSGHVILDAHVDVGANTCIDRAALGNTTIGLNTKIDNLAQIGHNVRIGQHSVICGQAGIAGSVTIGDKVVLGGQSGVADHLSIASGARIAGHAGVSQNIEAPGDYAGYPTLPASRWRRASMLMARLPQLLRKLDLQDGRDDKN